ncbi:MAG: SDR family oxidoreductase [Planctomycetales bacterium]|nr:SDR family oxidoreductase [Planctomycetales bacterium]
MADSLFDVAEQIVVVSGGSRGIGRAIAVGFAQRGATVIATGRDAQALQATAERLAADGGRARTFACDVANPEAIRDFAKQVSEEFGRVDTLVNCAGVNRRKAAETVSDDDYDFVLDINLRGAFVMTRELGRGMLSRGTGNVINIASLNTDRPLKNVAPYAMSKSGMGAMTRALALEWGARGVRVNAIAPGFILTDLTTKLWADPTMRAWGERNTPLGRLGEPQDMVGAAIFLASPAAGFMTGQTLYVDGGFTAGWNWPIPE